MRCRLRPSVTNGNRKVFCYVLFDKCTYVDNLGSMARRRCVSYFFSRYIWLMKWGRVMDRILATEIL